MKKLDCVLLVDDNPATNNLNKRILKRSGICEDIHMAFNGQEALDYLTLTGKYETEDRNQCPLPNLILLDINMPVMDGFEFLQEYATLPEENKAGAITVMLTTSLSADDFEKAKQFEIGDFINKPLEQDMLLDVINNLFQKGI